MWALFLLIAALFAPRVVIVVLALFTDFLARAYEGLLLPLLGFLFLPLTTLVYAWAQNSAGGVKGTFWLVVMVVAIVIDIGSWGWHVRRR